MTAMQSSVIDHLRACTVLSLSIQLPEYQIPASDFPKVKRAIEGIGGVWNRKAQAFGFDAPPEPLFERICQGEEINLERSFRKRTQFFETPEEVIESMFQFVGVDRDARVLEPSAGRGALIKALKRLEPHHEGFIDYCEMEADHRANIEILAEENGWNNLRCVGWDFLEHPKPKQGYHLILANPPFSKDQDIKHFYHMYDMLEPGGRMVVVMSVSWLKSSRPVHREFRDWLGYFFHDVVEMPANAFHKSGTSVRTCVVRLDKPLDEAY